MPLDDVDSDSGSASDELVDEDQAELTPVSGPHSVHLSQSPIVDLGSQAGGDSVQSGHASAELRAHSQHSPERRQLFRNWGGFDEALDVASAGADSAASPPAADSVQVTIPEPSASDALQASVDISAGSKWEGEEVIIMGTALLNNTNHGCH